MTPLLTPTEALDRLAGGLDDTAFVGSGGVGDGDGLPLLAVALTDDPADAVWLDRVAALLRTAPVVTVGVVVGDGPLPGYATELDALLCDRLDPPRPWVGAPDGALAEIGRLSAAVAEAPQAATALVQLLHVGEPLAAVDAVVAESFVYSLLQAGEHHRAWLAARAVRDRRPRPDGPVVRVERRAGTLALTLDRVEVRNANGTRMRDELVSGLALAELDPTVERVELRGAGPAFCSGGDLDEFGTAADPVSAHGVRTTRSAGVHIARVADRVTAYVHGACVGAGVELPAFAHEVVARSDTTFLLPEVGMGLVPGAGGTASVPRRIGRHRAAYLALSGVPIDASTAAAWGLVDRVDDGSFPDPPVRPDPPDAPDPALGQEDR
jgi:enoyl-CoA hydratase/carnithine racemase